MGDVKAVRYGLWYMQLTLDFYNFKDFYFFLKMFYTNQGGKKASFADFVQNGEMHFCTGRKG